MAITLEQNITCSKTHFDGTVMFKVSGRVILGHAYFRTREHMANVKLWAGDRPSNSYSFYTFSLVCGHYIWRRGYVRWRRKHSTASRGRGATKSPSRTGDTTSSSSYVRIERHQDACIHGGPWPRRKRQPLEKVEERASHSFQVFPNFKYPRSRRCISYLWWRTNWRTDRISQRRPTRFTATSGEQNEFDKIIAKLDNRFIPMVNPDCARSKLDKLCQMKGEWIAQYHVSLRL